MPESSGHSVLSNDERFPISVLHVLSKNCTQRAAHVVPTPDSRRLINFASASGEPEIEFIVLVADEFLIEITNPLEGMLLPATVDNGIDIALIVNPVRACPADGDTRMKLGANCFFHECRRCGLHWPADIVGAGFFHHGQALPDI